MLNTLLSVPFLLYVLLLSPGTGLALTAENLNLVLCDRLEQCNADFSDPQTDNESNNMRRWLPVIYAQTGLQPLWVTKDGHGEKAGILFSVLKNSEMDGLVPEQYNVQRITSLWNGKTAEELIELDTLLTLSFIMYAHDAQNGRVYSESSKPVLIKSKKAPEFDGLMLVKAAISSLDLNQFLADLLPSHKYYKNLRAALPYYRNLAATGGWSSIVPGKTIHPDEQDSRIPAIWKRLWIEGFIKSAITDSPVYDEALVQAVRQFQLRHGLTSDGVIGKGTIAAMNISVENKIKKIILNLERWRWEAHDLGKKYVLVDVAGFTLEGIVDDAVVLEMAVIVGTQEHETPLFTDHIQYIDINPYWNVPPSIARNEMLGELRKNPYYLNSNHIRLFSDRTPEASELNPLSINWKEISLKKMGQFKLRQDPGKWNALGAIKFVFPNSYNVYMHDTPAQSLFQRSKRDFSHGCIRLSSPLKLAEFLLAGDKEEWLMDRFKEIIGTGKRTVIRLPSPIPVHITYQTVRSGQNGVISFYPDIYARDQQLEQLLFKE
ncbi:MAG: L,D-transpeptidase family protein [Proteobacteria bacterium]|nr:L,D-transpeptidase family protein [Desulfocapsa sp.]MBU3943371.1 L,D-transpeptidase family protein [Pseudomonadota bacterium]MCG2744652.1 L,D-transpeptidase family protein [Desulfobacteraceae bacterium]MBU4029989.1 L,D-transpeptidase family protein [Pseudomonadota bacterium]MBU4041856.1 L,D-transpeptidase family protein [Pseudomonadota bacterium]